MKRKSKAAIIFMIVIVIVIIFLFLYPRLAARNGNNQVSKVPCLVPNLPLLQHIHPHLTIIVDGQAEALPVGIGIGACEKAIHTHDDDAAAGVIHVESQDAREYTLGDFFNVWGKPIEREGYKLETEVDGQIVQNPAGTILKEGQQIMMTYSKL